MDQGWGTLGIYTKVWDFIKWEICIDWEGRRVGKSDNGIMEKEGWLCQNGGHLGTRGGVKGSFGCELFYFYFYKLMFGDLTEQYFRKKQ